MVDYQQCFIANMKAYRKKKCISQAQLAEACNVSNGTIGNIECGITKPSFDLILHIADQLDIKPEALFYTAEHMHIPAEPTDTFSKKQLQAIRRVFSAAVDTALLDLEK